MDELQKEIPKLLVQNVFIKKETREKVLKALPELPKENLMLLNSHLTKGIEQQRKLFKAAYEKNPNFLSDVKHMVSAERIEMIHEKEAASRKEEESILASLDAELAKI